MCKDLTSLINGQSITRHCNLFLRGSDPVHHSPPALNREGEVGVCGGGALMDAQHWEGQREQDLVSKTHW